VLAPLAVIVVEEPEHIVGLAFEIDIVGSGLTVITAVVEDIHPLEEVPVTV